MRKFLVRLLCMFLPNEQTRHKVRRALSRSKYDIILEQIAKINNDISNDRKSLTNRVDSLLQYQNKMGQDVNALVEFKEQMTKPVEKPENYVFNGVNNKLFVWSAEKNDYVPYTGILEQVYIRVNGDNNVIKLGNIPVIKQLDILIDSSDNLVQIGNKVDSKWAHIDGLIIVMPYNKCECIIGDDCLFANGDVVISLGEPKSKIHIGKRVRVAEKCRIMASDFHPIIDVETGKCINYGYGKRCLTVGDYCWLGMSSLIGKGCILPDYTIVAAHSVVTKKYEEQNTIIAGNPAQVVKRGVRRMCDDWADVIDAKDL